MQIVFRLRRLNRSFSITTGQRVNNSTRRKSSNYRNNNTNNANNTHDLINYSAITTMTNTEIMNGWQAKMAATYGTPPVVSKSIQESSSSINKTGRNGSSGGGGGGGGRRATNVERALSRTSSVLSRSSPNSSHKLTNNNYSQLILKRKQTIMICFISLAFFICQLPIKVFQMFNTFYEYPQVSDEQSAHRFTILNLIFLSAKLLYFLHGMSNPIIYNLMSTKFNESFRKVILCKPLDYNIKKKDPVLAVKI